MFQRLGISIDEFYEKPPGVRAFMLASMRVQLEIENKKKEKGGG
jgi:hypothetical protein